MSDFTQICIQAIYLDFYLIFYATSHLYVLYEQQKVGWAMINKRFSMISLVKMVLIDVLFKDRDHALAL